MHDLVVLKADAEDIGIGNLTSDDRTSVATSTPDADRGVVAVYMGGDNNDFYSAG